MGADQRKVVGQNNWWFERHEDGSVEVRCTTGRVMLDKFDWAAVVAAMASSRSYQEALSFNQGDIGC